MVRSLASITPLALQGTRHVPELPYPDSRGPRPWTQRAPTNTGSRDAYEAVTTVGLWEDALATA